MRLKKWMLLIVFVFFFLSFGYLSYTEFSGDGHFGILLGVVSLVFVYQIITFLIKRKKDGWNSSYVIADSRTAHTITTSFAVSYIYILVFLLIGVIGLYNGFFSSHPLNVIWGAIITSILVFMVSQITQRLFR